MYTTVIVDDEKIMRDVLTAYIQANAPDFEVKGAFVDGQDALAYAEVHPVDLIITDIRMRHMSGLELVKAVNDRHRDCHFIVISGYNEFAYAKEAMKYGVQSYLLKPVDLDELAERLSVARDSLERSRARAARETDLTNENASLFFYYLLTGVIKSPTDIKIAVEKLSLPFSVASKVWTLDIRITKPESDRYYGREERVIALANILRMERSDFHVYHVYGYEAHFFFVITGDKDWLFDAEHINTAIYNLLSINGKAECIHMADSVLALADMPPDKWFVRMMRASVSPKESGDNLITPEPDSDKALLVQGVKAYVQQHYAKDISREDAAKAIFLSATYMSRVFKTYTGMSFIDYLTTVRMNKAVELVATNARISDIAEKVGYRSRNTFLVNFRRFTSYSPTEYKRRVLRQEGRFE